MYPLIISIKQFLTNQSEIVISNRVFLSIHQKYSRIFKKIRLAQHLHVQMTIIYCVNKFLKKNILIIKVMEFQIRTKKYKY